MPSRVDNPQPAVAAVQPQPRGVHPKVAASGVVGAVITLVLAAVHLVSDGSVGVDQPTLEAAALTVVTFAAGYFRAA